MEGPDVVSMERVHALWDQLANFSTGAVEEARRHFLTGLCELVDAQNVTWVGVVRMDTHPEDPYLGWRPRLIHLLHPDARIAAAAAEQARRVEQGETDPVVTHNLKALGRLRVTRLEDVVPPEWLEDAYYKRFWLDAGRVDSLWACAPVNEDTEVYLGLHRDLGRPRYSPEERDRVTYAMRGLRWFHRQQMLGFGLLVAKTPLTPVERNVLRQLLSGQSEKEIAQSLDYSTSFVHEYVTRIYRKYGVRSRAELSALWLGKSA